MYWENTEATGITSRNSHKMWDPTVSELLHACMCAYACMHIYTQRETEWIMFLSILFNGKTQEYN